MPPRSRHDSNVRAAAAAAAASAAVASAAVPPMGAPVAAADGPSAASARIVSECEICTLSFEFDEKSARYPRVLPCGHTFCHSCIQSHIKARGPGRFTCPMHNEPILAQVSDAKSVVGNFALVEMLQKWVSDPDHQAVDERAKAPSCSECDTPAVWYCRNDDACFCDAHKVSVHAAKSLSKHTIVPVAERVEEIPKCPTHKAKDLDMWCTLCNTLCCYMCAQFGKHKEHQGCLAPVENAAFERRNKLKLVAERTQQLSSIQMDQTALNLVSLRNEFESSVEGTARAIDKLADSVTQAVSARANELHEEARKQGAAGLKNLQLRIDDLTACRSKATAAAEEAKRVLRMTDHAVLKHVASVLQADQRSEQSWAAFQANLSEPQPMQLVSKPQCLLDDIASHAAVFVPVHKVQNGKEVQQQPAPVLLSKQGAQLQEQQHQMQSLHAQLRQREAEARQRDAELKRNVAFLGTLRALTSASFCRYCATKRSEAKESAVCHSANRYVNHWGQYDPHHRQAKEHEWALPVTKEVLDHEFMIPPSM